SRLTPPRPAGPVGQRVGRFPSPGGGAEGRVAARDVRRRPPAVVDPAGRRHPAGHALPHPEGTDEPGRVRGVRLPRPHDRPPGPPGVHPLRVLPRDDRLPTGDRPPARSGRLLWDRPRPVYPPRPRPDGTTPQIPPGPSGALPPVPVGTAAAQEPRGT